MDEEVLVFQCIVSQLPTSTLATSSTRPLSGMMTNEQSSGPPTVVQPTSEQRQSGALPPRIQVSESTDSPTTTLPSSVSHVASNIPNLSVQPPVPQSIHISSQNSAAAQQATQQTMTPSSSHSSLRLNVQMVPIQYQAILLKSPIFSS